MTKELRLELHALIAKAQKEDKATAGLLALIALADLTGKTTLLLEEVYRANLRLERH